MRSNRTYATWVKPLVDRAAAGVLLVLLAPLLLVVAVAVYFVLGPPIVYRQVRPGFRERPFVPLKFRTMSDARDESGKPLDDAARLSRFGQFLRRTSLDELPQLINVVRGELSFIGPRPLLSEYIPLYSAEQRRRHDVRPGLTGLAQVAGRNALEWPERLRLDVEYVDTVSPLVDLRILAATLRVVLSGRGVSAEGHSTVPRFRGNSIQ